MAECLWKKNGVLWQGREEEGSKFKAQSLSKSGGKKQQNKTKHLPAQQNGIDLGK